MGLQGVLPGVAVCSGFSVFPGVYVCQGVSAGDAEEDADGGPGCGVTEDDTGTELEG